MNVDELIERTSLDAVLSRYGLPLVSASPSGEYRMKCLFNDACSESTYGNLCVSLDTVKRIYCHTCGVRGNLLTLLFGLEYKRAQRRSAYAAQSSRMQWPSCARLTAWQRASFVEQSSASDQPTEVSGNSWTLPVPNRRRMQPRKVTLRILPTRQCATEAA